MDSIVKACKEFCHANGFERTYWVGYSGGLDSHVLLHALAQVRIEYPIQLKAIYINHGLSQQAAAWAEHCAQVCQQFNIDFADHSIQINSSSHDSLEELARDGRYTVFAGLMGSQDLLCTAHHQDDQAETVLLQMLRGSGPKGLAAMPRIKPFAQGWHARPLLDFTRDELKNYADQHQLKWIEDESNSNTHFTRNFLRHDILPLLKNRWPSVTEVLARVADNCAEAQHVLDTVVEPLLHSVTGSVANTLSVTKVLHLNEIQQRHVLRAWLEQLHFPGLPAIKLQQIQKDILQAREDKTPYFTWRGVELRRYRDDLYAMSSLPLHDAQQAFIWDDLSQPLVLPGIGTLRAELSLGKGLRSDINNISVRFRQGGEVLHLPGRTCHHELKSCFRNGVFRHGSANEFR